jgi:hypothetical protein
MMGKQLGGFLRHSPGWPRSPDWKNRQLMQVSCVTAIEGSGVIVLVIVIRRPLDVILSGRQSVLHDSANRTIGEGSRVSDLSKAKRRSSKRQRGAHLRVRVSESERRVFEAAADLIGTDLSTWTRAELRRAAVKELKDAGRYHELVDVM